MATPPSGVKGVCVSPDDKTGTTKPFGRKGVIFAFAGATTPQGVAIHGVPYSRKGITVKTGFMPAPSGPEGEELEVDPEQGKFPRRDEDEEDVFDPFDPEADQKEGETRE